MELILGSIKQSSWSTQNGYVFRVAVWMEAALSLKEKLFKQAAAEISGRNSIESNEWLTGWQISRFGCQGSKCLPDFENQRDRCRRSLGSCGSRGSHEWSGGGLTAVGEAGDESRDDSMGFKASYMKWSLTALLPRFFPSPMMKLFKKRMWLSSTLIQPETMKLIPFRKSWHQSNNQSTTYSIVHSSIYWSTQVSVPTRQFFDAVFRIQCHFKAPWSFREDWFSFCSFSESILSYSEWWIHLLISRARVVLLYEGVNCDCSEDFEEVNPPTSSVSLSSPLPPTPPNAPLNRSVPSIQVLDKPRNPVLYPYSPPLSPPWWKLRLTVMVTLSDLYTHHLPRVSL